MWKTHRLFIKSAFCKHHAFTSLSHPPLPHPCQNWEQFLHIQGQGNLAANLNRVSPAFTHHTSASRLFNSTCPDVTAWFVGPPAASPLWSDQSKAAPVSASNTLLGSHKMLKATTEREAGLSASERQRLKGRRRKDKKASWGQIKDSQEESQIAESEGDMVPGAGEKDPPTHTPTHRAMRFKLGQTVTRAIKLLNVPGGRKWSIVHLRQSLSEVEKETWTYFPPVLYLLIYPPTYLPATLFPYPGRKLCVTSFCRGRWRCLFLFYFIFLREGARETQNEHRENANVVRLRLIVRRDTGG